MVDMVAEGIADWRSMIGHPFEFRFGTSGLPQPLPQPPGEYN
jgi:hypothetical protein